MLDPAVLSTLPQSMQLQIMEQMRDQLHAFNRDKFTSRSGQPENFSSFQLQTFLKASTFRCVVLIPSVHLAVHVFSLCIAFTSCLYDVVVALDTDFV